MNIRDYNRTIKQSRAGQSTRSDVLLPAAKIAQGMELEFVAPAHVLLAILCSPHALQLREKLERLGITYAVVLDSLRGAPFWTLSPSRSEVAMERMFTIADEPLHGREFGGIEPTYGVGSLVVACLAAGDPVITMAIETGLRITIFEVLVKFDASDEVLQRCVPDGIAQQLEEMLEMAR